MRWGGQPPSIGLGKVFFLLTPDNPLGFGASFFNPFFVSFQLVFVQVCVGQKTPSIGLQRVPRG